MKADCKVLMTEVFPFGFSYDCLTFMPAVPKVSVKLGSSLFSGYTVERSQNKLNISEFVL